MFRTPDNLFANVKCPDLASNGYCVVVNCLFDHSTQKRKADPEETTSKRLKTDNSTILISSAPSSDETPKVIEKDILFVVPRALETGLLIPRVDRIDNTKKISHFLSSKQSSLTPNKDAINKEYEIAYASSNIEDYKDRIAELLCLKGRRVPASDLSRIQPIEVNPSPALLPIRRRFIELFVNAIKAQNPLLKVPIWTATEEEYKIASTSTSTTYNVAIKNRIYEINHPEKASKKGRKVFTKDQYLRELKKYCIDHEKLVKFGFVMKTPDAIKHPEEIRHCHRCKLEFKLRDAGTKVDCRYHSGKIITTALKERKYLCCGGILGATDTDPCVKSQFHVFYWANPLEMHHSLPYLETKRVWGVRRKSLEAVGIDCEMGFTTRGFELLRITAIDFFSGEEVIDILVRPKGKVLDLNTRWSGIANIKEEAVSFEDSITLLGEILDSNTILVGHGLENDMNAMRLIHPKIVDTAVLFPRHKATPTFRFALKQLAFQYLGRNIQVGEHDSGEDSLAAIDVTKHFIEKDLERDQRRAST